MIPMEKVQRGLTLFIDNEIAPGLQGWDKVIVAGAGGLFVAKLPAIVSQYANHPMIKALGIYDESKNEVDLDALYNAIIPQIGTESLPVKIPMLGITMKVGRREVDALYNYINKEI